MQRTHLPIQAIRITIKKQQQIRMQKRLLLLKKELNKLLAKKYRHSSRKFKLSTLVATIVKY